MSDLNVAVRYHIFRTHKSDYSSELSYINRLIAGTRLIGGKVEIPKLTVAEAYLLSAAAKDLSILIALKRVSRLVFDTWRLYCHSRRTTFDIKLWKMMNCLIKTDRVLVSVLF